MIGTEIVERIADHEGVDPVDLDMRLHDIIDPDALETLTNGARDRQSQATLRVEFTYYGYAVTVDGDGGVSIGEQSRKRTETSQWEKRRTALRKTSRPNSTTVREH